MFSIEHRFDVKITKMKPVAYYITAHGYGHGTRSCDVLRALHRLYPEQPVIVTSDLPRDFLDSRLKGCPNITVRRGAFDVGLIQKDSIQSNLPETLKALETLYAREELFIEQERIFLEESGAAMVIADIPAIPLAAAQRAGIRNAAVGNFSWDWIYEAYVPQNPRWAFFAEKFRAVYENTGLLLRLPFAPPMEQFPNRKNIPLLASPGVPQREKLAALTGAAIQKQWVLLSFTALDINNRALENIRALSREYEFFCVQPLNFSGSCIHAVDRAQVCFANVLASCDIIISKPGFGLVSECIVNRKPLIYSDRGDFAEYPYLVEGIEKYLRNVHLPLAQLYAGDFSHALKKIKSAPEPEEHLTSGGAEMIVQAVIRSGES